MGRFFLFVAAAGAFGVYTGYQERALARGSSSEPLEVELSQIEAGNVPENKHLRIGTHWKVFEGAVYEYRPTGEHHYGEPDASTKVNYLYYPIVSTASKKSQGDSVWGFSVLVRTTRYKTVGAIPAEDMKLGKTVQGLVTNEVQSLNSDERRLLRESFSTVNFDNVLLLQEGRKPVSETGYLGFMGGGAVAVLIGLAGAYKSFTESA